jgi:hypothetical protein
MRHYDTHEARDLDNALPSSDNESPLIRSGKGPSSF